MAKRNNVVKLPDAAKAPDGDQKAVQTISRAEFDKLVKKCGTMQANMDEDRASLGGVISEAVEHKRLHKGAFGIARRLNKMDPYKLAELLFHLDTYRNWLEWDKNKPADMFEDRAAPAAE